MSFESGSSGNQFSKWNFSTPRAAWIARPFLSGTSGIERNLENMIKSHLVSMAPVIHSRKRVQTDGSQMGKYGFVILAEAFLILHPLSWNSLLNFIFY